MSIPTFPPLRSALVHCAFSLFSASASAQAVEFVIFTGVNSGVSTVDDLSALQAKGQKVVCGALGDATRIACNALGSRLRLDIEIASVPSSGPAFMMTRANRMTILPLPIKLAESVRPNDGIRPIATTGPALSILGQEVPSIASSSGVNRAQVDKARDERIAAEQKAMQDKLQREQKADEEACPLYYPGKVGKIKGDAPFATADAFVVRYVNKDRLRVTIEGTSGGNSLKLGEVLEFSCGTLRRYER